MPSIGKYNPTTGGAGAKGAAASSRAVLYKMSDGVSGIKPGTGGGAAAAGLKVMGSGAMSDAKGAEGASSREQQMILNLKRQVEELEASNSALRVGAKASAAVDGALSMSALASAGDGGMDATIRQLRADYQRTEAAQKAREAQLQAANDKLRKEALSAKLRERKALDEVAEAKEHLTEQREKFASARQELTAEVIAYQRDLDELAQQKRQLQADLADAQAELQEREAFVKSFDTQKRMLESQLHAKEGEAARHMVSVNALRVELGEERVQFAALKEKYDTLRAHQQQVGDLNTANLEAAATARAELRTLQIDLEGEQKARRHAEEAKSFLVMEAAKLEATITELTASADFIAQENHRLKTENESNKVMKVVGKFMVRKMREKLGEAQASEKSMRDNQDALNARYVGAEQKALAIERELSVLRRRQAEREAMYEQQRSDAAELSVENRVLLEKAEQLVADGQRMRARLDAAEAAHVDASAELDVLRERLEVTQALGSNFRPEDLAVVSRVNAELASSIQALLPRLGGGDGAGARGKAPGDASGVPLL